MAASLFGTGRNVFGSAVGALGRAAGLPEFGISERISGQAAPQPAAQPAAQPRSFVGPQVTLESPLPTGFGQAGQVLGATTAAPTGGGAAPAPSGTGQIPLEQAPQAPSIDFNAIIQPGLQALSQAEEAARGIFGAQEADIGAQEERGIAEAQRAEQEALGQVESQQAREERRGEEAVGEQRRGFSQLARNLAARFGAGISTGLGAEAIAGQQALRNISNIRAGLAETISDLNTRRQSIQDITRNAVREAESNANVLRQQARASLQQALADIGGRRGELQSRRAELVFSAVENFRNTVSQVNARNAAFQQQLFRDQQQADLTLRNSISRAQQTAQDLPTFELTPGQTRLIPTSQLGDQPLVPEGTDITTGTVGPFTSITAPGGETGETPEERINRLFGTGQ